MRYGNKNKTIKAISHRLQRLVLRFFSYFWVAEYCSCIYESSFEFLSLHKSAIGAYKAMKAHMLKEYQQEFERRIQFGKRYNRGEKYLIYQAWRIHKVKLFP